jgi:hypothetical protein
MKLLANMHSKEASRIPVHETPTNDLRIPNRPLVPRKLTDFLAQKISDLKGSNHQTESMILLLCLLDFVQLKRC